MGDGARIDAVLEQLRARGGRVTSPRRAILEALIAADTHPTAEQITAAVRSSQPDVDRSTVYRFLDDLEKMGVVDHVHLGHGAAVYHFADDAHHHLVCDGCDAVVEVPAAVFASLRKRLRTDYGFDVDARHFAVPGRCAACASDG